MSPKKSNLNTARSKETRRNRVERVHQSAEQIATRNTAQRSRTAEGRAQESQEQRDEHLRQLLRWIYSKRATAHFIPTTSNSSSVNRRRAFFQSLTLLTSHEHRLGNAASAQSGRPIDLRTSVYCMLIIAFSEKFSAKRYFV
ncbi:hypothetical protein WA026_004306 [Henosepilachna vigintioctopunctata]|uniref:Uncharacterized protein n=1 Tax=Henosepilachna vigintioctopunctata TaxID=420089 RepID=A0AAW1VAW0_9CUCU